ncbi:polysaccharide biosynthesis protein [Paenibacillus sp. CC-CFT747]|nr:polysaccharide biosynthesis protein [Paenibacillus sp. CC-CFT747]
MLSKDSLIKGTVILAAAALVARVLGVVQRVPLVYLIHDSGMATYSIAFNIYMLLLTIATAGIPSALSKLVAERMELGRFAEANRIYRAAIQFALVAGVIMTVFLYFYAPFQAERSGDPDAALAIQALAPALLLFPLIAIMRGYFQGRRNMMPNGLSQIIEQVMRLLTAIGLAYLFLAIGWGQMWAVAGASFGGVMGSVGAVAVLLYYAMRLKKRDAAEGQVPTEEEMEHAAALPYKRIYKSLFRTSIPIVLFSLAVPLIYFIDSSTVIPLLQGSLGWEAARDQLGILAGRAQSLAGIPIILAIALSQSIVPIISSAYAKKDLVQVKGQAAKALQLSLLTGLPAVIMIAVAARPINGLLFPDENGFGIIALLTATALFQIVMQTSGAILMGMGAMKPLVGHVVIGIAVKLLANYVLSPLLGIYGIVTATALCFIVMMGLNLRTMKQKADFRIFDTRRWIGLTVTAALMIAAGVAVEWLGHRYIRWFPAKLDYLLQAAVAGAVMFGLYLVLLALTKVVTAEDLESYPAPIRKLVRKGARVMGR